MIGPILLAVTWLLLRLEGKRLSAIGIDRPVRRLAEFAVGFAILGLAATIQQLGLSAATGDSFVRNVDFQPTALLNQIRFVVNSVLSEEFVFRGYLLYQAIRWLGPRRAVWLDAVVFGIYHWFSYGVFGSPIAMAYVLVMTGAMGLMWARAFTATKSIAAPIGLHLGWNTISYIIFSAGPLGAAMLVPASGAHQIKASGWAWVALNVCLPVAMTAIVVSLCRWYEGRVPAVQTRVAVAAAAH